MTTAVDTMGLARAERADLADLLATLTPEQWDAPTLCTEWRVRDVVAHVFSYEDLEHRRARRPLRRAAASTATGSTPSGSPRTPTTATDELLALVRTTSSPAG